LSLIFPKEVLLIASSPRRHDPFKMRVVEYLGISWERVAGCLKRARAERARTHATPVKTC